MARLSLQSTIVIICAGLYSNILYADVAPQQDREQLSRENQQLQNALKEETLKNKRIEKLERKLKKIESKAKTDKKSLKTWVSKKVDRFDLRGYWSAGAAMGTHNNDFDNGGFNEKPSFRSDAIVALQFSFMLGENDTLVVQLVAPGLQNFDIGAEWAYLSHKVNDQLTLRAGRLRTPYYFFSDTIDVGFVYPWVRPPLEIYVASQPTLEGADILYRFNAFGWNHSAQIIGGTSTFDFEPIELYDPLAGQLIIKSHDGRVKIEENYSLNITSSHADWTIRLGYSHMFFNNIFNAYSGNLLLESQDVGQRGEYYNAALQYDDGKWLALLEGGFFNAKNIALVPDNKAGYFMFGRRFGNWLPYITIAKSYTVKDPDEFAVVPKPPIEEQFSTSLGLRYNYSPKISLKWQVDHFTDFNGTLGIFGDDADFDNSTTIYTFVIDSVF